MLAPASLGLEDVVATWRPYQALDPELVLARAKHVLEPPATAALEMRGGVLGRLKATAERNVAEAAAAQGGNGKAPAKAVTRRRRPSAGSGSD